jgi:hypothetical protein
MMLTGEIAAKSHYKCAVCNGPLIEEISIYITRHFGALHSDFNTGERWAICSPECIEVFQTNPLAYKASYRVNRLRRLYEIYEN